MELDLIDDPLSRRLAELSPERRALLRTLLDENEPDAGGGAQPGPGGGTPGATAGSAARAAASDVEARVIAICEQVMGRRDLSREDDFFERGGDSITAMRVAARAQRDGLALTVRDIVTLRTIAAMAAAASDAAAPKTSGTEREAASAGTPEQANAERFADAGLTRDELDGLFAD